jgi:hypothetical protein
MIEFSLEELSSNSSDIIITKVIDKRTFKDNLHNRIYTEIKLQIIDVVKGKKNKGEVIKLLAYGGTYDGITTLVVGALTFVIGEETLLFLQNKNGGYSIFGSAQGKYNVFIDKNTNEKKINREQISVPLSEKKNGNKIFITDTQSIMLVKS